MKHPPGFTCGFKNGYIIPRLGQLISAGHAGRTGAHNRDFFILFLGWFFKSKTFFQTEITHRSFNAIDVNRCPVKVCPVAGGFAGMRANSAGNSWKRIITGENFPHISKGSAAIEKI